MPPFCSLGKAGAQEQDFTILLPVFGGEMAAARIQAVREVKSEDFSLSFAEKYDASLDGPDRQNLV